MKYLFLIYIFFIINCSKTVPCSVLDSGCNVLGYFLPNLIIPKSPTQTSATSRITFTGASSLSILTSTTVSLSWTAATSSASASSAIVYNIYSSTTSGTQNFTTPLQTTSAGITSITLTVTANTDNYFVVRAKDTTNNEDKNTEERAALLNGLIRFIPLDATALATGEKIGSGVVTPINAPPLNATDRKGIPNNSYTLNGTSQLFRFEGNLPVALPTVNSPRTYCLWIKLIGAFGVALSHGQVATSGLQIEKPATTARLVAVFDMGVTPNPIGPAVENTSIWNFVCAAYNPIGVGGIVTFQLNSNSSNNVFSVNVNTTNPTPNLPIIGAYSPTTPSLWVNGSITEVSIWNRNLTPAELLQVYKN